MSSEVVGPGMDLVSEKPLTAVAEEKAQVPLHYHRGSVPLAEGPQESDEDIARRFEAKRMNKRGSRTSSLKATASPRTSKVNEALLAASRPTLVVPKQAGDRDSDSDSTQSSKSSKSSQSSKSSKSTKSSDAEEKATKSITSDVPLAKATPLARLASFEQKGAAGQMGQVTPPPLPPQALPRRSVQEPLGPGQSLQGFEEPKYSGPPSPTGQAIATFETAAKLPPPPRASRGSSSSSEGEARPPSRLTTEAVVSVPDPDSKLKDEEKEVVEVVPKEDETQLTQRHPAAATESSEREEAVPSGEPSQWVTTLKLWVALCVAFPLWASDAVPEAYHNNVHAAKERSEGAEPSKGLCVGLAAMAFVTTWLWSLLWPVMACIAPHETKGRLRTAQASLERRLVALGAPAETVRRISQAD